MLSAKQIAPGQSGQLEVSIKTENLAGPVTKTVTVQSNDPHQQQVMLILTAEVVPEFGLSAPSLYFGTVPKGAEVAKELVVTIPPEKSVKLLSAESTDSTVSVKMEVVAGSNEKRYKIVGTQKPDSKEGYHFGFIVVKTSSQLTPELKIPVRGVVRAPRSN